jgi:hypothetical protein
VAGVDYAAVRSLVSMRQVLELLQFKPSEQRNNQWRGRCPLQCSVPWDSRAFSVNLDLGRFQCFRCKAIGHQLELWAAVRQMPLYDGAVDLCERAGVPVPWVTRW